jgi:hypothetical protein
MAPSEALLFVTVTQAMCINEKPDFMPQEFRPSLLYY